MTSKTTWHQRIGPAMIGSVVGFIIAHAIIGVLSPPHSIAPLVFAGLGAVFAFIWVTVRG